jgi:hypothetical protein
MVKRKQRRKRRAFTPEFKAEAVRLCQVGDRTIRQVADDLDLTETALRAWVKQPDAFERNLARNLYRIWNRLCSGSYFPTPVMQDCVTWACPPKRLRLH